MKHNQTKLVLDGIRRKARSFLGSSHSKRSRHHFDLGAVFGMPGHKLKRSVVSALSSLTVFVAIAFLSLMSVPTRALASTVSQSNWSGGVGMSLEDNQYFNASNVSPTPTNVEIGSQDQSAWCSTPTCSPSWNKRQALYVYNAVDQSSRTLNNYTVRVTVPYEAGMKADFSDLRFTSADGVTDYAYYLERVQNSVTAEVWVTIPALTGGPNTAYMYFGNGAAPPTSTLGAFEHDNLAANDTTGLINYGCNENVSNATYTVSAACGVTFLDDRDHSVGRVFEYDYKPDLSTVPCGNQNGNSAANYIVTSYADEQNKTLVGFRWLDNSFCQTSPQYYIAGTNGPDGTQGYNADPASSGVFKFSSDRFYRFRQVNHWRGGTDFYYSADNGATYTAIPQFSPNDRTDMAAHVGFNTDQYPISVKNLRAYNNDTIDEGHNLGIVETYGGRMGYLTSGIIDLDGHLVPGNVTTATTGSGIVGIQIKSTNNTADLEYNWDIADCNILKPGDSIASSTCVRRGDRYYQYRVILSDSGAHNLRVTGVNLDYLIDNSPPSAVQFIVMRKGSGGPIVANNGWFNPGYTPGSPFPRAPYPVISWGVSTDDQGGSGIAGYCLYIGTDPDADMTQAGVINASSPVNTYGTCAYATTSTSVDLAALTNNANFEQSTHYVKIRAIDVAGNLSSSVTQNTFRVDTTPPYIGSAPFYPNGIVNSKNFTVSFGAGPGSYSDTGGSDGGSGIAGWKYCIGELDTNTGTPDGCYEDIHQYFGDGHVGSGDPYDPAGATAFDDNLIRGFTTTPADYPRIVTNGYNGVNFALIDQAGNFAGFNAGVVRTSSVAASAPQSLQLTQSDSQANAFAFTWSTPQTYQGPTSEIDYCYTVNEPVASDASNCHWTGKNITQLASGPYATQQGVNTLYVMARDQSQNYSTTDVATVTFTANTTAPGAPEDLDISDVSVRSASSWKLAVAWAAPSQPGSGIAAYKVLRSTDNVSYSEAGSTSNSNLSFIDAGLSQVTYYYQVKACDNAGNCSIASNTVSRKPTGRFTAPANLVLGSGLPVATDIGTRKVTVQWQTDRESDSKIALGTVSGQYGSEETGSSNQVTSHSVNLTNLLPGTQYFYVAKWTDGDGNTGVSAERTFTTSPAPSVGEVTAGNILVDSATISFTTTSSTSVRLNYGKTQSFGGVEKLNTSYDTSTYSIPLNALDDDSKYYYQFTLTDREGNEYEGNINSFTTTARPKITNIRREGIEGEPSSTQRFTWDTNIPTSSALIYNAQGEQQQEAIDSKLTLTHSLTLTALKDTTTYTYFLRSRDEAGNTVTSDRADFTTALDTRPPKISDVVVETAIRGTGTEARGQITVAWKTDEPSTSQVAFGQGQSGDYTGRTYEDATMTTEHVVVISDLPTSSVYHLQAMSRDAASNEGDSESQSVVLGRASDNIFSVIFDALSKIFGLSTGKQE